MTTTRKSNDHLPTSISDSPTHELPPPPPPPFMRLKLVPPSALCKIKNKAKADERDKYRVLPRRSPWQHQASLAADQYRQQFHSNTVFFHRTQRVFFKISISGYAIIDHHARTASQIYPFGDTDSFDSSDNPRVPDDSDSSVNPTDWI